MQIGTLNIDLQRKAIKHLHITVLPPTGMVRVSAPLTMSDESVRLAVASRLVWIGKQQRQFAAQARQSEREMLPKESHYLWGERYLLKTVHTQGKHSIALDHKKLVLSTRPNTSRANQLALLEQFYRSQLKQEIAQLLAIWQPKMGVTVNRFGVKKMKTLWGSCNTDTASIWLNLELAKKPKQCLEYVVVHELVHLLERHHNDRFLAYMDKFLPHWRATKKLLNELALGV